jgi:hypothetical protein
MTAALVQVSTDRSPKLQLAHLKSHLSEITTVDVAKEWADRAAAIERYAKKANCKLREQNEVAFAKLCYLRKAGELLKAMPRAPRGGAQSGRGEKHSLTHGECLLRLGISWTTAGKWEGLTKFSEADLEGMRDDCTHNERELTTAYVVRQLDYQTHHPWEGHYQTRQDEQRLHESVNALFRCLTPLQPTSALAQMVSVIVQERDYLTAHTKQLLSDHARAAVSALAPLCQ